MADTQQEGRPLYDVAEYGVGAHALRAMREQTSPLCELIVPAAADSFAAWTSALHLRSAILFESRTSQLRFDRTALHVARSSLDHYLVAIYLRGTSHVTSGKHEIIVSPGDIAIHDMALASRTVIAPASGEDRAHSVTLTMPRALLAPLLAAPDAVGYQRISGETAYGRILRSAILSLWRNGRELSYAEAEAVTRSIAALVAGCLRLAPGGDDSAQVEATVGREAIRSALDRASNAATTIDVGSLCRSFGISRATLYRMFEPEGGLVNHVRRRQLGRARAMLTSAAHRHLRVIDVAMQHGFRTESGFIRAFRRAFGVTPAELRATGGEHASSGVAAEGPAEPREGLGWLLDLGAVTGGEGRSGAISRAGTPR